MSQSSAASWRLTLADPANPRMHQSIIRENGKASSQRSCTSFATPVRVYPTGTLSSSSTCSPTRSFELLVALCVAGFIAAWSSRTWPDALFWVLESPAAGTNPYCGTMLLDWRWHNWYHGTGSNLPKVESLRVVNLTLALHALPTHCPFRERSGRCRKHPTS